MSTDNKKYILRSYQEDAVNKMEWCMSQPGNDVVCIAQGGGKSLVIADFVHRTQKPALILCPNKEILQQNMDKFLTYVDKGEVGVYSASMDRKDINTFTFATIQSCYKRPGLFQDFNLAIVDECDLVPMKKMSGMYRTFFRNANIKKVIGMTGTPWRQDTFYKEPPGGWGEHRARKARGQITPLEVVTTTKMINRYTGGFWTRMLYVLNTKELLSDGFLSPLEYVNATVIPHDKIPLNKGKSEFDLEAFEKMREDTENEDFATAMAFCVREVREHILVFCTSIEQATQLSEKTPLNSAVITSRTTKKERKRIIKEFKEGKIRVVFNVQVLTVGFDFPDLDTIILLRPTRSLRLHLQILGRGTRLSEKSDKCTVIDLAGNVRSLGRLEDIEVKKLSDGWNVVSPAQPSGFHMQPLFSFKLDL